MEATVDKHGKSLRLQQNKLYLTCHKYLNDNFHKFSEANKIKISLTLGGKMAPSTMPEGSSGGGHTKIIIIRDGEKHDAGSGVEVKSVSRQISV